MIKGAEIQKKASQEGVRDQQIEKDYILSWVLRGIALHANLSKVMVFKGGTVLKKVYFEDYRFSEDLDFTLIDSCTDEQIFGWFNELFSSIKESANIPLLIVDNTLHEDGGLNFYVNYVGPLGGIGSNKKIKIDIARNEKLEFASVIKPAVTSYSDLVDHPHDLLCYSLEEVIVEKLRAVMQRTQARDFYDIWYLTETHNMEPEYHVAEFRRKCELKNQIAGEFFKKLEQKIPSYKGQWKKSLEDQIKNLPDFDGVEREIFRNLKNFKP
jgi:predicted nucleotidyltransferase component of viral defense system